MGVTRHRYVMPRRLPLVYGKTHRRRSPHLNGGDAHLAVALGKMPVAGRVQPAGHGHGDEQAGTFRQLLGVHIPAVLPGRDGAQPFAGNDAAGRNRVLRVRRRGNPAPARVFRFPRRPFL